MPTILGVNFGREFLPEILEKQGQKFCGEFWPSKFAEKFAGNFPYNSPDQNKQFTPNPLCRISGSTFCLPMKMGVVLPQLPVG